MNYQTIALVTGAVFTLTVSPSLHAAEQDVVIVTANRMAQSADETLAAVTVITRKEIEQSQAQDVIDLLRLQTGIDVTRYGGPGTGTSVFMRGTNSSHTLVLIDGVRASSATTGSFAWQHLSVSDIERIEIVRGPRAAQYGSDAIGGVIQIFTRKNKQLQLRAEGGSYNTRLFEAGIGGGSKFKYSLNLSARDSDGFSATNDKNYSYDADDDGYRNRSLSGNIAVPFGDKTELSINGWYSGSENEYDQGIQDNRNHTLNVRLSNQTMTNWNQTLSVGQARDDIKTTSAYPSRIKTDRVMADWQHDITLSQNHLLTAGLSTYTDKAINQNLSSNTTVFDKSVRNNALFLILQSRLGSHDVNLSGRVDDHETYGTHKTGQIAWGYNATPALRFTASYGTAFRAPTLNELYHPGFGGYYSGNPQLKQENSRTSEIGSRYTISKAQQLRLTAYRTTIDGLISYQGTNRQAINIAKARIDGLEVEHDYQRGLWSLLTRFTLQKAIDDSDKSDLVRRPRQKLSLQLQRKFSSDGNLGIEWLYASERLDGSAKDKRLDAYNLVNLSGRKEISKHLWLEGRVENLLDEDYELIYSYNTAGRSYYAGISYTLGK